MKNLFYQASKLLLPVNLRKQIVFMSILFSQISIFTYAQTAYAPGKIAVLVVGDGSAALVNSATPLFVKEFNVSGLTQSGTVRTILPTTATSSTSAVARAVTQSGTSTSEGLLNLSTNGQFLTLAGYNSTTGTLTVSGSSAAVFPTNTRVIAKIDATGTANTITTCNTAYSTTAIRSATTVNGTAYWTSGATGLLYVPDANIATPTTLGTTNTRGIGIHNSQLYTTTASGALRLATVGSGLPTTGTPTLTNLNGFLTASGDPYGFTFIDINGGGPDVVYVASLTSLGLLKYTSSDNGLTWTARGSLTGFVFGVTGVYNSCSGNVDLYITSNTANAKPNSLYKFSDLAVTVASPANITSNGSALNGVGIATLLATAATNTAFGGVAFTPNTNLAAPSLFSVTGGNGCSSPGVTIGLSGSATGINYQLFNGVTGGAIVAGTGGAISFGNISTAGSYTVVATNPLTGCTATMTGSIIINPSPVGIISASAATVCSGTSITLSFTASTGTGPFDIIVNGTTYTNIASGSIFATTSPTLSSTYTLTSITDKGVTPNCPFTLSQAVNVTVTPQPTWYKDVDNDLYGDGTTLTQCTQPTNYYLPSHFTALSGDCNDAVAVINPAATEVCGNGIDDDCDGAIDENNALAFDGTNDYVQVTNSGSVTGTYTVEVWAKPLHATNSICILGSRGSNDFGFDLKFMAGNKIHADIGKSSGWIFTNADATLNYTVGTWYHIAYVVTPFTYTIYINGAQAGSGVYIFGTAVLYDASHTLCLGLPGTNYIAGLTEAFNGQVDEVRIWNTERTQAQIQASMYTELSPQAGLINYYKFNQGIANGTNTGINTLTDASGNGNTGTLNNFALTGNVSNWSGGVTRTFYQDLDGDTYGNPLVSLANFCAPSGYVFNNTDCNDAVATINPAATEVCGNGVDDDCDGQIDENNALAFNGSSNVSGPYVSLVATAGLSTANDFTLEAWVYPTAANNWERIFDFGTGNTNYYFLAASSGTTMKPRFGIKTTATSEQSVDASSALTLNQWSHVAFTLSGNTGTLYINGIVVGTNTSMTNRPSGVGVTTNNWLGRSQFSADFYYAGRIDEARIWTIARTQAQIQTSMNTDLLTQSGLLAYYKFDQGTSNGTNTGITSLTDASGNSFTGTLNTFALTGTNSNWTSGYSSLLWYKDTDNDLYSDGTTLTQCSQPTGYYLASHFTALSGDCNDNDAAIYPNSPFTINCAANINATLQSCGANTTVAAPIVRSNCTANGALAFDGTNDYVQVNSSASLSGTYTIEVWAKPLHATNTMSILGTRGSGEFSFDVKFQGGNKVHADIGNTGGTWLTTAADANLSYVVGTWYHIAYVVTSSGYTIYINGVQSGSGSFSGTPLLFNSTHTLCLGLPGTIYIAGLVEMFNGQLDEVRIWNTARTQAEIQANMNLKLTGLETGLVRYYDLNDGSGTTAKDNSANAVNGTLNNFALSGTTSNWVAGQTAIPNYGLINNFNNTNSATGVYPVGTTSVLWTAKTNSQTATCIQTVTLANPTPVVTASVSVCVGSNYQATTTLTGGSWSSNSANATVSATGLVTGVSAGAASISYVSTTNGCTSTEVTNVTIYALPVQNPVNNQTICSGINTTAVNFTASVPSSFSWSNSNTAIGLAASGTGNIPSFAAVNTGNTPVTSTVTVVPTSITQIINGSLGAGDLALSNRLFRDGNPSVCGTLKTFPGTVGTAGSYFYDLYSFKNTTASSICVTVTYISNSTGNVFVTAYNGSFNPANLATNYLADGGFGSARGLFSFSLDVAANATIILVANEATSTESCPSYTITINPLQLCAGAPVQFTYTVNPSPTASISSNDYNLCNGESTTLTASGVGDYLWSNSATTAAITVSPASTTNYTVTVTGANTCTSTASANIIVNPLPVATAISNQTLCNGGSFAAVNFTANIPSVFNWSNSNTAIGLGLNGTGDIASFAATNTGNTPITATITATPSAGKYAYIADYIANQISVLDRAANTIIATINVGDQPTGVSVSPDGSRVYVANLGSSNVSVINTTTNTVIATIPVGNYPGGDFPVGIITSPDGSRVYVANVSSGTVSVINTATNTVIATVTGITNSTELTISPDGSRLYVGAYDSNIYAVNTATNTLISTINTGGSSAITGLAVSPDGSKIYAVDNFGFLKVINGTTNALIASINVGIRLQGVAVSPDGSKVYVTDFFGNSVSVINTATNTVTATIGVGSAPQGAALSSDGSRLYVTNQGSNNVSVINTATNTVVNTIATPTGNGNYEIPSLGNFVAGSGCAGTPVTFTFTINPTPAGTLSAPSVVCSGSVPQLTFNATNGVGPYTLLINGVSYPNIVSGVPFAATAAISANTIYTLTNITDNIYPTCPSTVSTAVTVNVVDAPTGVTATASAATVCPGATVNLFSTFSVPTPILSQDFESGLGSWTTQNLTTTTGTGNVANTAWTLQNHGYVYTTTTFNSPGGTKFLMSNADAGLTGTNVNTILTSPAFSTMGNSSLTISYRHYFRYISPTIGYVEASTDGTNWTTLKSYNTTQGTPTVFTTDNISLNAYGNLPIVYLRFRYQSGWGYFWALDDIKVLPQTAVWTSVPTGFNSSLQNPTSVTVAVPTTYTMTVTNVCGTTSASVAVATYPVATITGTTSVCKGLTTQLTASQTGGTWSSSNTAIATVGSTTGLVTTQSPGTVTINYLVTSPNGCTLPIATPVTVLSLPVISAVTASLTSVCPGGSTNLSATTFNGTDVTGYTFSASSGTFTQLTSATSVAAIQADDAVSAAIPLGFTFNYNGSNYTQVVASSNGVLFFGSTGSTATVNNLTSFSTRPFVAPLFDDLQGNLGTAYYLVTGTAGNRVFTFEWLNYRWLYTVVNPTISFQCKLYEASGKVEFVYRQEVAALGGVSESASIGLAGIASGKFLSLNNASASPTASSVTETNTINTKPATGQVYAFTPPQPVSTYSYNWSANSTYLSAANIQNPIAQNVTSSQTYSVLVTSFNGCTAQSGPVTVNVIPAPIGTISASSICPSGSVDLTFTATVGTGPFDIVVNGITYPNVVSGTVFATFTPTVQSTTYTLTSIKDNGVTLACVSTVSNFITVAFPIWYADADGDGFGDPLVSTYSCSQPPGYVANNTDCNDNVIGGFVINPGATEICGNGIDENCNGMLDDVCTTGITFNLIVFIQGFYDTGTHLMAPVLSNTGVGINPLECDIITVELYDQISTTAPFISTTTMLFIDGTATMQFPNSVNGHSYYIVVKHRNSMETWSKDPVLFTGNPVTFDFTAP